MSQTSQAQTSKPPGQGRPGGRPGQGRPGQGRPGGRPGQGRPRRERKPIVEP